MSPAHTPQPGKDADTRDRILQAGTDLFSKKGFNGTGLNEILTQAAVPKGSFYHYFGSKEEFGVVLIERARDEYMAELMPMLSNRKLSPVQRLRSVFEHTRDACRADGPTIECLIPKLALETGTLSEPVHAAVKSAYQVRSALLSQVIREGQTAGEIACQQDPDRLANVLVMLWEGAAIRMQIERNVEPLDDFLTFVFDSLLETAP